MSTTAAEAGLVESQPAAESNSNTARLDVGRLTDLASRVSREMDFANGLGDVQLIIKHDDSGETVYESFLASSAAMILACDPWKCLLAGWCAESQLDHPKIFDYTEEDSTALQIVMNIIHLRFSEVPHTMGLDDLASLAILTDRFFLTAAMSPWSKNWIENLTTTVEESGNEVWWSWISRAFDRPDLFQQIAHKLCLNVSLAQSSGNLTASDLDEGHIDSRGYQLVRVDGSHIHEEFPPGIEEAILTRRQETIGNLLESIYGYFDRLREKAQSINNETPSTEDEREFNSLCANKKRDCLLLQMGSMLCALESLGLWPKKCASDVLISATRLGQDLIKIQLSDCRHHDFPFPKSRKNKHHRAADYEDLPRSTCGSFAVVLQQMEAIFS